MGGRQDNSFIYLKRNRMASEGEYDVKAEKLTYVTLCFDIHFRGAHRGCEPASVSSTISLGSVVHGE